MTIGARRNKSRAESRKVLFLENNFRKSIEKATHKILQGTTYIPYRRKSNATKPSRNIDGTT
jgi:hypothetical protein